MNNAKMWLVVKPTVGVPLFLGAVAVTSLAVHVAVVSQTVWYTNYVRGIGINTPAPRASLPAPHAATDTAVLKQGQQPGEMILVMPDGRTGRVVLEAPRDGTLAMAAPLPH